MPSLKKFLPKSEHARIANAIREAESKSSGEIRVYFEKHCKQDVLDRAADVFRGLNMHQTTDRTGILIYVAYKDQLLAIVGDTGIHEKVQQTFWDQTEKQMEQYFREGKFSEGLIKGINLAGEHLKKHFPRDKDDVNELPDNIIIRNE